MTRPTDRPWSVVLALTLGASVMVGGIAPAEAVDIDPAGSAASHAAVRQTTHHFLPGLAQVASGFPVRRGLVRAETLQGKRLTVHWGAHKSLRRSQSTGAFALPLRGLPSRFVVVVRGGTIHGRRSRGTFRAVVTPEVRRNVAQVSLGTTVQTSLYRSLRGRKSFSRKALRKAHNRTLHTVRLPRFLQLGFDDRVNPRFVNGRRLQKYAKKAGGYRSLNRRVVHLALRHGTIPLASRVGRVTPVQQSDVVEDCSEAAFEFTPEALTECAASGALTVANYAMNNTSDSQAAADLMDIYGDIHALQTQLSDLQAEVKTDFLDLLVSIDDDDYNTAAGDLSTITDGISSAMTSLEALSGTTPSQANQTVMADALNNLVGQLDPATVGGLASGAIATELAAGTISNGVAGLGTLPAAWQLIRAEQASGSLGATTNGDAALGQGTTLLTNEMSAAFANPGDYWFNQLQLLGILTANYYNYTYTQQKVTPVATQTAYVLGGFSSSGTCPGGNPSPAPVACPGSLSYNLMEQIQTTPMTVPPGTVIDPNQGLIWGTAVNTAVSGTTSGTGLPNNLVPGLLNQVQAGDTTPWSGVNSELLAVSPVFGLGDWALPEVNFATGGSNDYVPRMSNAAWPYSAGDSPQLGAQGSGSGLLGGIGAGNDLGDLAGLTSPPAFPSGIAMWADSNLWSYVDSYWNGQQRCWKVEGTTCDGPFGGLPSGAVQFEGGIDQCGSPFPDLPTPAWGGASGVGPCPNGDPTVAAAVVLNAPIPAADYQYPADYSDTLLSDPTELANQIQMFRQ